MRHRTRTAVTAGLLTAALVAGCSSRQPVTMNASAPAPTIDDSATFELDGEYRYHYYPNARVYYAPDRDM